jgi:ribosome-associated toxin RatA of RatAB toxin-antitoxin module
VSYEAPRWILSESHNSRIFEGLHSHWEIKKLDEDVCEIVYNIQMTFSNPLYSSITTNFFDYLANNINKAFEKRCEELYYKDRLLGVKKVKVEPH